MDPFTVGEGKTSVAAYCRGNAILLLRRRCTLGVPAMGISVGALVFCLLICLYKLMLPVVHCTTCEKKAPKAPSCDSCCPGLHMEAVNRSGDGRALDQ